MTIRDYDPSQGQCFQGDVAIVPVPDGIAIATIDEISPVAGRLILQEGEVTGHHHAVTLDPQQGRTRRFRREGDSGLDRADPFAGASPGLRKRLSGGVRAKAGVRMYRDQTAAQAMVAAGILERTDLAVGFLVVESAPAVVQHEEHAGIRLPVGRYYVGRQVESVGAEERRAAD